MRANVRDRPPWLARVGTGAGVLIAPDLVLTCHQVVSRVARPDLRAELVHVGHTSDAEVEVEVPIRDDDGGGDLAVLRLAEPVPRPVVAPLRRPVAWADHPYVVQGFARGHVESRGTLGGWVGPGWVQLNGSSGHVLDAGFAGAPVWDDVVGGVVGLVVAADKPVGGGHLLPVEEIVRLWPGAAGYVGWRLDLDDAYDTHWLPRARGVEPHESADVWHFVGRHRALHEVATHLAGPPDGRVRAVVGSPGSGKSAVLARTVVLADRVTRLLVPSEDLDPSVALPPPITVAVHARGLTLPDVVRAIADAAEVEAGDANQLLQRCGPVSVVVDALDEAAGDAPVHLATLLSRFANRDRHVVVGTRVGARGGAANALLNRLRDPVVLDLDSPAYLDRADVVRYLENRLGDPATAAAIAERADGNFLIAQLAALTGGTGLATTVGAAVDDYLSVRFDNPRRVRDLLLPLAFAEGTGLPEGALWLDLANALTLGDYTARDLRDVLESAASYLVEQSDRTYRLFHQALDDTFRAEHTGPEPELVVHETLARHRNTAYTRDHFLAHAAAAGRVDEALTDIDLLLTAEPHRVLPYLHHARSNQAKAIAAVYRRSSHDFAGQTVPHRAAQFALVAQQLGGEAVADMITTPLPWRAHVVGWRTDAGSEVIARPVNPFGTYVWFDGDGNPVILSSRNDGAEFHRYRDHRLEGVAIVGPPGGLILGFARIRDEDGEDVLLTVSGPGGHVAKLTHGSEVRRCGWISTDLASPSDVALVREPSGRLLGAVADSTKVFLLDLTADEPVVLVRRPVSQARPAVTLGVRDGTTYLAHTEKNDRLEVFRLGAGDVLEKLGDLPDCLCTRFTTDALGRLLLISGGAYAIAAVEVTERNLDPVTGFACDPVDYLTEAQLPDGRSLVAFVTVSGELLLWDTADEGGPAVRGQEIRVWAGTVAIGAGPEIRLATSGGSGAVRLWDLSEPAWTGVGSLDQSMFHLLSATALATFVGVTTGMGEGVLASLGSDGLLEVWTVRSCSPIRLGSFRLPPERSGDNTWLSVTPDGAGAVVVAAASGGHVSVLRFDRGGSRLLGRRAGNPARLSLYRSSTGSLRLLVTDQHVVRIHAVDDSVTELASTRTTSVELCPDSVGPLVVMEALEGSTSTVRLYSLADDRFTPVSESWACGLPTVSTVASTGSLLVATGVARDTVDVWCRPESGPVRLLAQVVVNATILNLEWRRDVLTVMCMSGVVELAF
ncbi:hypothetical protein [Actinosynnema sp. NPDC020468]|uniref:serine protease n=1 Tax=Actinosynnema sp. NPDC020468 TaxID=3154488 RepID=UPI0033F942CF